MKSLLICFLVACLTYLDGQKNNRFRCDYTYFKDINGYLKYHKIPSNWHEAWLRCDMEGSVLASPLTPKLKEAMLSLSVGNPLDGVFTGIHSMFSRGDFFSVEGVPLSKISHAWVGGQPDNENDQEGCIVMTYDNGRFVDISCDETMPYVCYKKDTPDLEINDCGTTDPAYSLDKRTGSCYKVHRYPRYWSRAYMTCAAEGGYLAIINSETEAKVIKDIYAKISPFSNVGPYYPELAFVGFHDWNEHGEWRTIQGQSLGEAGYNKWLPGNPDNSSGSQFCGAIHRNILLDDMYCHNRAMFICEMDPTSLTCPEDY